MRLGPHRQVRRSHVLSIAGTAMPLAAAPYRASGFVRWHLSDVTSLADEVRSLGQSRLEPKTPTLPSLTHLRHMCLQEAFIETRHAMGIGNSALGRCRVPDDRSSIGSESALADRYGPSVAVYDLAALARSE
jgi:hypothetical protein